MTKLRNRQDACSTKKFICCGTGILPVPDGDNLERFKSPLQFLPICVVGDRLPLKKYSQKLLGIFIKIYYTPRKVRQ